MSVEAIAWVLNHAPVKSPVSKLVLVALANHARPDGSSAFPSVSTICRYTCLSERSVRQHLEALEKAGIIRRCDQSIVAAYIKRSDRRPIGYDILLSGVQEAHPGPTRGAEGAGDGVHDIPERGARDAPETYNEPSLEPHTALMKEFYELLVANTPSGVRCQTPSRDWSDAFNAILAQGATSEQIIGAARWAMRDRWWRRNIRSPMMLKRHWERLMVEYAAGQPPAEQDPIDSALDDAITVVMNLVRLRNSEEQIMDYIGGKNERIREYLTAHLGEIREMARS